MKISTALDRTRGIAPGFDLLRIAAASAVLVSHAFPLTSGSDAAEPLYVLSGGQMTIGGLAVLVFFAVSGFVIAASLERTASLQAFFWRRALRLVPGLAVVVTVSALVVGPIASQLPAAAYFQQPSVYGYLANIVLAAKFSLPGVFAHNPFSGAVNGSLWTLRWEVLSYLALAVIWRIPQRGVWIGLAVGGALLAGALSKQLPPQGIIAVLPQALPMVATFMAGAWLFAARERVALSAGAAFACLLAIMLASAAHVLILAGPAIAYICLWIGFLPLPRLNSDLSYGVYLWAFPVQQVAAALIPDLSWWGDLALAAPATFLLAALSWRWVEKPALGFRLRQGPRFSSSRTWPA